MSTRTVIPTASDHDMVIAVLGHKGETVGFLNLGDASDHNLMADLDDGVENGVTVYGIAEGSDRKILLKEWTNANESGYDTWYVARDGRTPGSAAVPILWEAAVWEYKGIRAVLAVPRAWVGAKGAGPEYSKPKVINIARLVHRGTDLEVAFMCTHPIPSVQRRGLPRAERQARRRHYRQHINAIAREVRATDTAVVVMLDANAPRWFNLLHPLKRAGLKGWTREGTHGNRAIDHILTRDAR